VHLQLDGLLFYHKRTHYTFGQSPLVVWLKAYMLPEILGISVPAEMLALAPSTYTGFTAHAETVRQKKHNRMERQKQQRDMEEEQTEQSCSDGRGQEHSHNVEEQTEQTCGDGKDQEHNHNMAEQTEQSCGDGKGQENNHSMEEREQRTSDDASIKQHLGQQHQADD